MKTKFLLLPLFASLFANAQSLTFQNLTDMPVGVGACTSVLVNNNIYVSNGYTANGTPEIFRDITLPITAGMFSIRC